MPKSLYVIDGHAQIFRAYYAPFPNLNSPTGEPTRATHVFFSMLLNLVRDRKPDYLAMALDVSDETTFRKGIYTEYKAHRDPPPEDLEPQIRRIISVIEAVGIPILRVPGFEADDVMATLATRFSAAVPVASALPGHVPVTSALPGHVPVTSALPGHVHVASGPRAGRGSHETARTVNPAPSSGADVAAGGLAGRGPELTPARASAAPVLAGEPLHLFLVSRDKDLDQLLGPNVFLFDPTKNQTIAAEDLFELKGWRPDQAVEVQCLVGDTVDNVPGVTGIGPKTAAKLIQKYGTARAVIEHAGELTPKQRENVLAFAPQLEITRQLVTLRRDVEFDFDLSAAAIERIRWSAAKPIFRELGFRKLTDQLPGGEILTTEPQGHREKEIEEEKLVQGSSRPLVRESLLAPDSAGIPSRTPTPSEPPAHDSAAPAPASIENQESQIENPPAAAEPPSPASSFQNPKSKIQDPRWSDLAAKLAEPVRGKYELVGTPAKLKRFVAVLKKQPAFALDSETTDINPIDADPVGLSFAWNVGEAYYLPLRAMTGDVLALDLVRDTLAPILADPAKLKVGQNIKYDLIVLRNAGLPVSGPMFDTMIASFVLDSTRRSHGIDALVAGLLGHQKIPTSDLIGRGADQLRMDHVPIQHVCEYACEDADYTWRLKLLFEAQLADSGMSDLFYKTEMPLVEVLAEMEFNGVTVDAAMLRKMGHTMAQRAAALSEEVQKLAGTRFNLDSPKQLGEVLFDKLALRVVKKTKTTRSTDAETLETLAAETKHPALELILEYRELQKLRGTYIDALPKAVSRRTGRIHTSFHQTGAVTGRLSSSEPNLQNIPIRSAAGREIRRAFVPRTPDERLIAADYSQIELRMLAHFCRDEALIRAFADDLDIHAFVAAQVNGVTLDAVTKDMRSRAKAVNFGIIYGQTAFGLSRTTGMNKTDAQKFIDDYFARYPRIREFIDQCIADARRTGHVTTILGRRREITGLDSPNRPERAMAERFAVNTVIQGSAADMIKTAMNNLHAHIAAQKLPLRLLLQVHDELVCETPLTAAEAHAALVRDTMSTAIPLSVPVKVDVAIAENWLEAK